MKYLECAIGRVDLIICDLTSGPMPRPLAANAPTTKGVTTMPTTVPELTTADLERALRDALTRQFVTKNPLGQIIGEVPTLEEVFGDSREVVYRREEKYWKAPFLVNSDQTATIGVGVTVGKSWITLSAVQRTDLEREVIAYFKPLKAAGDLDPVVKEVRAKDAEKGSLIALFAGAYYDMPFLFEGPKCWVSSPRPVEREGSTFRPPSNKTGGDIVAATDMIIAAVRKMGRQIRYGDAQIIAAQLTDRSCPTTKSELEPLLGKVFAMIAEEERRQPAKRGGTR